MVKSGRLFNPIATGVLTPGMNSSRNYVVEGELEAVYEVEQEIIEDLERQGYDDNALFSIRLALDEALINALKHGNKGDPTRTLKIDYQSDDNRAVISVEDEGEGFDHQNLTDPTEMEHLRRTHGRGIFLIRKFTHDVKFNEKGNCITFTYKKEPSRTGEFLGLRWVKRKETLVLTIEDVFGYPQTGQWEERICKFVSDGHHKVIFDLGRVEIINTTILSLLVMVAQTLKEVGGQCRVCGPQNRAVGVLRTTNLDQLIPVHPDLDSALEAMEEEPTQSA